MIPFRTLELRDSGEGREGREGRGSFPFTLPVFTTFEALSFTHAVTFFVGENGCGKSTLLEIIGAGLR